MNNRIYCTVALLLAVIAAGCSITDPDPVAPNPVLSVFADTDSVKVEIYSVSSLTEQIMAKSTPVVEYSGLAPMIQQEFQAGLYTVKVSRRGYYTQVQHHELVPGGRLALDFEMELVPEGEPEPVQLTASLALPYAAQVDEQIIIEVRTNGLLGILTYNGEVHFTQAGVYQFHFTPREAREYHVSYFVLGESDQIATLLGTLTVTDTPPEVGVNAWIVGDPEVTVGHKGRFGWAASTSADSVTAHPYYTENNVGLWGESDTDEILVDTKLTIYAWKDGVVYDERELFFTAKPAEPAPEPVLHFRGSGEEIEDEVYQVRRGSQTWLVWLVEHHDGDRDRVLVDKYPGVEFGAAGLQPVTVKADTSFTMTVIRDGVLVQGKMVNFRVTDDPIPEPDYIELMWTVDKWVGQRPGDPHQATLMDGIRLPANVMVKVFADLEYSLESSDQDDETCGMYFFADSGEYWAVDDSRPCPRKLPDQGHGVHQRVYVGTVTGFQEEDGRMVMVTGADIDCDGKSGNKCQNPNSVHITKVVLRIYLPQ